jgi:hypothetical protein
VYLRPKTKGQLGGCPVLEGGRAVNWQHAGPQRCPVHAPLLPPAAGAPAHP